ncbi:pilus assembly protein TadG-related protein [Uliginosibacterium aquaticum]|uniref:Putative Flp pilus-assembly TadG-like N-terminal domain-containing protein n=1 Tax=Uliginosibacterium aquaticum TaxID=2731212 RepID=A0ABX2IL22_9RHOO|nr:pilus assembly protein TadG-related protein [Uliginosibacterium aquaticum]NSL54730.1 hypothetical protein [Uliginosibacterium aquaticum]
MRANITKPQGGGIAIMVALSLAVLVGFAGLVLDLGRLYVNRSELQTSADACALAAAAELVCDPALAGACTAGILLDAENAGVLAAARNNRDFQATAAVVTTADVRFSMNFVPNGAYLTRATANPASKFVMCIARADGIVPRFMRALNANIGPASLTATAVATQSPSQNSCEVIPLGVCSKSGGYTVGAWLHSNFTSAGNNDDLDGSFRWVDFTPNAGGNSEIRDQLAGVNQVCDLQIGSPVQQPGQQQGAKSAYNTHFGIYPNGANAYSPDPASPNYVQPADTGYAYPNKSPATTIIAIDTSAYADFVTRAGRNDPFIPGEYGVSGPGGNISGNPQDSSVLSLGNRSRRLVTVPMINCAGGRDVTIDAWACVLMLNPMSNGASGTLYLEYRGLATDADSPCTTSGTPGGFGPLVPVLVQ